MMIEVRSEVTVQEYDGSETFRNEGPNLIVCSRHYLDWITIEVNGHTYSVRATDLLAAIQNAQNVGP